MPGERVVRWTIFTALVAVLISSFPLQSAADDPKILTNSIGMNLVEIPAGEFMMGAEEDFEETLNKFPYSDPKWLEGELPQHLVRITKPFYIGQYEVTLNEFLKFYEDAKYKIEPERDNDPVGTNTNIDKMEPNRFRPWDPNAQKLNLNHPMIYASWIDAVAFCNWLSKKERVKYRLPTEAEWEYACRAGTMTRYSFGDEPEDLTRFGNSADANVRHSMPNAVVVKFDKGKKTDATIPFPYLARRDGYVWTSPVGVFKPNDFGLYDMHGNAWEWCSDWYDENYYEDSPTDDPQGPKNGTTRVLRGGDCRAAAVSLRSASRQDAAPSSRSLRSSFRVVRIP